MHERPSSFTDLAFQSFPVSRGNPLGQVDILKAARHIAPDIPLPPYAEFKGELVPMLVDFFAQHKTHPNIGGQAVINDEIARRPAELYQAFRDGLGEELRDIAEVTIAHQIERDHWFMVEGHRQSKSVVREQIINPDNKTDEELELGSRIKHPVFRQLFVLLRQTWNNPQSRSNILALRISRAGDIEDSNCFNTCKTVGRTLDHVAEVWETRNNQPFYSSYALVQS